MKRYESYKESGVPWIATIPVDWKKQKNTHLFVERQELSVSGEETLLSLSQYTGITLKSNAAKAGMREAESKVGYRIVYKDDIVMNIMLAWNGSTAVSPLDGIISPAYAIYKPVKGIVPQYFHYLFRIPAVCSYFEANSTGLIKSRLRLYSDSFKRLFSIVPPLAEQDQIVRYLDWQVSKINRLIAAKRKQIDLLQTKRQKELSHVMQYGLCTDDPVRDTGLRWIGESPARWKITALKRCATLRSGITLGKQYAHGTKLISVPYLRVANVQTGYVDTSDIAILDVTEEEAVQYQLPTGCVLMTEGGDRDKLGRGCVWDGSVYPCIHQNHVFAVVTNDKLLSNRYLEYLSASDLGRIYFDITAIRTTNLACTNATKVLNFTFPLPERDEQEQIILYLDKEMGKYDILIKGIQREIVLLQDLRVRLISDVVTGQVDVRDIEVPEYEMVEEAIDEQEEETEEIMDET